ncbi:MAG: polysaccharide biosynthesis tyrosine autokinase [Armatimonadetes bacterium]|nr:polysaccharide biosynthesis tyrosine autokinase [Armatimonadota bacterium]
MELWRYFRILYRRKWLIIVGMVLCVGIAAYLAIAQEPKYTAYIHVVQQMPDTAGQTVYPESIYTGVDNDMRLANLATIATSADVRMLLFDKLRNSQDLMGLKGYPGADPDKFDEFWQGVQVYPERGTQFVRINVTSPNMQLSRETAKVLASTFETYYQDNVFNPSRVTENLRTQVEDARQRMQKALNAMAEYKRTHSVNDLSANTQARISRLSDMETQWHVAQVTAQENANRLRTLTEQLKKQPFMRKEGQQLGENQLWVTYRNQLTQREQDLAAMMAHRGPAHPEVKALQESINDLKSQLATEQQRKLLTETEGVNPVYTQALSNVISAKADTIGSQARAQALAAVVPQMRAQLANYPEDERALSNLAVEAKASQDAYGMLRQKFEEARVREAEPYKAGIIKVVEEEATPVPVTSTKRLQIALALPLSILLSCAIIFLLDYLDNSIRSPEEVEELLGLPVSAMVALGKGHSMIRGKSDPGLRESFQMLASSLWHQKVEHSGSGAILVASAEPDSGRTVVAGNLAASLAADGARVILVDADMRQPHQHLVFGLDNSKGFSNLLAGSAKIEDVALPTKVEGLLLIPSGPLPDNPMRLLRSDAMRHFVEEASGVADFVIFDSPAGAAFADPTVIAAYVKQVLLVQSAGRVPRGAENEFRSRLEQIGAEFVGVVLNKVRPDDSHSIYHFRTAYGRLPGSTPPAGSLGSTSPAIPG